MTTIDPSQFDPSKHVPVVVDVPQEDVGDMRSRPDIPPPSPYSVGAKVRHAKTGQEAVIHRVEHATRLVRLWYPDRRHLPNAEQYDPRTTWQSFETWEPEVTLSPEEVARQTALAAYETELSELDASQLELAAVFCDDADPTRALRKLRAFRASGLAGAKSAPEKTEKPNGK